MEEEYQGYRITANSREQADRMWLPVAELEVHHGGAVTTKPPVVALPQEARRTKQDADVAAIAMAKKWIDRG